MSVNGNKEINANSSGDPVNSLENGSESLEDDQMDALNQSKMD